MVIAASATLNAQKCQPPPVEVEEVQHVAEQDPVDQVAGRAADDERQPEPRQPLFRRAAWPTYTVSPTSAAVCTSASTAVLNGKVDAVQQPERRAGIVDPRQVEEAGNDRRCSRSSSSRGRTSAFTT